MFELLLMQDKVLRALQEGCGVGSENKFKR
jgi:hypothetical protein